MKNNVLAIALAAIIGIVMLAPLANVSGEQTMGLEMTYGPVGGTGGDTHLTFPQMNTSTFPDYWSTNSISVKNNGSETWNYWELHLNSMAGDNHSYTMQENYTIRVYSHNGQLDQEITADSNAKAIFQHTLLKNKWMYVTIKLHPDHAYEIDNYTLPYCLYAYTDPPSNDPGTRALTSDTESGTTALSVLSTMGISLSYTGTHPDEVYFTSAVGLETVQSTNYLRVTNTGNTQIDQFKLHVSTFSWLDVNEVATSYVLSGNTQAKEPTEGTFTNLDPTGTWTYATWLPGVFREYRMQMINADLPAATYHITIYALADNTALGLSDSKYPMLVYAPYAGTLDVGMTYTPSGTGFEFPDSDPGSTNVLTTNQAIVSNSASSDYKVDTIEFLFQPLSDGMGHHITFANNADLFILDSGDTGFTIPLTAYSSSGITYGRALIDLDDADNAKVDFLDPGDSLKFSFKLYEIPADTPSGSYSSTFTVTCAANPVIKLPGEIVFPPRIDPVDPPEPEYFTITPRITNSTGGENITTGDPTSFNLTTNYGYLGYRSFLWKIYDEDGELVKEIPWININMSRTVATYANTAIPAEPAPTYTFTKPGNYTAEITPIDYNGNLLPDYTVTEAINVTGADISNVNNNTALLNTIATAGIVIAIIILVVILGTIFLATRKRRP